MGNRMGPRGRGSLLAPEPWRRAHPSPRQHREQSKGTGPVIQCPFSLVSGPRMALRHLTTEGKGTRRCSRRTAERAQGTSDGPLGSPPYHGRMAGPCPGTAPGEASGDEKQTRASDPSTASLPSPVSTQLASCLQSPHTSRGLGSEPRRQHCPPPEAGEGVLVPSNLGRRFWLSHLGEGCSW